jgi:nucleotide sugar dehydrogenase
VAADRIGVDVDAIIRASNSQPYSHIHAPGIAVGGHCIPVYPHFLLSSVEGLRLPAVAREINSSMPHHAVQMLEHALTDLRGLRIAVLGLAYRGGVKEHAFSGAFSLVEELRSRGAIPLVHDPLYDDGELRSFGLTPFHLGDTADAAIVQADHAEYRDLDPPQLVGVRVILDGRRMLDPTRWSGVDVRRIGAGDGVRPR